MKEKKVFDRVIVLLAAVILILGDSRYVSASAGESSVTAVEVIVADEMEEVELRPGETTHVKVPVLCGTLGYTMNNVRVMASMTKEEGQGSSPFRIKNVKLSRPHTLDVQDTIPYGEVNPSIVEFDIVCLETVREGQYSANLTFKSKYGAFTSNTITIPCVVRQELQTAAIGIQSFSYDKEDAKPGNTLKLTLVVKNEGEMLASNTAVSVECVKIGEGNVDLKPSYTGNKIKIGNLRPNETFKVTVPVKVMKNAVDGLKLLKFTFTYKDAEGKLQSNVNEDYNVDVSVDKEDLHYPALAFTDSRLEGSLKAGSKFKAVLTLKNKGDAEAEGIRVSVTDGISQDGVVADFAGSYIPVKKIEPGDTATVTIPLAISKEAAKGIRSIKVVASWKDSDGKEKDPSGKEYTDYTMISPSIKVKEEKKKDKKGGIPNIVISSVVQSPSSPNAEGTVTMKFDIANLGDADAVDLKIGATGLTADTFSPMTSDPYIYIEKLKKEKSRSITMSFRLSKNIPEGFGAIPLSYSYKYGEEHTEVTGTASLNVLNIVNETGDLSKSVPKLIVSSTKSTPEAPRAGQVFTFDYFIQNTHSSVAAKNIKVTIAQADNIFSMASGGNSFYIDKIAAGETKKYSVELKVKNDATTKAYPLTITMAYEYDGAAANPQTGKIGEEVVETINLLAVENTRAEVENMYMEEWNVLAVGQPNTLHFAFYNMGKSPLNNVCCRVEGDFQKTDGEKQIIGTVNAGEVTDVEMEITPLMEGEVTAKLIFTFEDSNGEEISMEKEYKTSVIADVPMDPGMMPMGPMEPQVEAKKPIVPWWGFAAIQAGILIIVTTVTKKIKIKSYKKKLERAESES